MVVASISGLILAGGQSRRLQELGPVDKGLLELAGQPLVQRAVNALSPYVSQVWISANQNIEQYAHYGQVLADDSSLGSWQGPLVGILTALERSSDEWLMCLPVDSPFVPNHLIPTLMQAAMQHPDKKAFYVRAERVHPLCLLIHHSAAPALRAYLEAGERRVQTWLKQIDAQAVDFGTEAETQFANINSVQDWQQAQQRWANVMR